MPQSNRDPDSWTGTGWEKPRSERQTRSHCIRPRGPGFQSHFLRPSPLGRSAHRAGEQRLPRERGYQAPPPAPGAAAEHAQSPWCTAGPALRLRPPCPGGISGCGAGLSRLLSRRRFPLTPPPLSSWWLIHYLVLKVSGQKVARAPLKKPPQWSGVRLARGPAGSRGGGAHGAPRRHFGPYWGEKKRKLGFDKGGMMSSEENVTSSRAH